jgi:hypothetical protein
MPMNPAAPENAPPITNPIAVVTSWRITSTIARTTATTAMIVYWRVR